MCQMRNRISSFNESHVRDMTPYEAFRKIDNEVRGMAQLLSRGFRDMAELAGFEIIEPFRVRHRKTGIQIEVRPKKEATKTDV